MVLVKIYNYNDNDNDNDYNDNDYNDNDYNKCLLYDKSEILICDICVFSYCCNCNRKIIQE